MLRGSKGHAKRLIYPGINTMKVVREAQTTVKIQPLYMGQ